jgi:hypothetical protein
VAFRVRCPRCSQTAEISEELLGRAGMCNNCGAMVAIPARLNKVCFECGKDVTNSAHKKDEARNYLCADCWMKRGGAESFVSSKIECSICHIQFSQEEAKLAHGQPICRGCAKILLAEQADDEVIPFSSDVPEEVGFVPRAPMARLEPSRSVAAIAEDAPPSLEDMAEIDLAPRPSVVSAPQWMAAPSPRVVRTSKVPLVLSSLALAGTIVLGLVEFSRPRRPVTNEVEKPIAPIVNSTSDEMLTRVLILKAQGEVLVEVGKVKEGIGRLDAMIALGADAAGNSAVAAEIEKAKAERERAVKMLAAATTQPAAAASDEKTTADPKKVKTIFDE